MDRETCSGKYANALAGWPTRSPRQGDVSLADLNPVQGHEQAGKRPVLIVSVDEFSAATHELAIVVPITTTDRGLRLDVRIEPPEGGGDRIAFAMPYQVRTISHARLARLRGRVTDEALRQVISRLRILTRPPPA
jgi:mRNA interferase MazF